MTLYISIALILLLSIGVLGVHETRDLFIDRAICSSQNKRKKQVHFSVLYPKDPSPAIATLMRNINLDSLATMDDSTFHGTMTQYCNHESCSVEGKQEPIPKLYKPSKLGVKETVADWPQNSRMSAYAEMKIQENKLNAFDRDPEKLRIAVIIANKLPYYKFGYFVKNHEEEMTQSIKNKFLYFQDIKRMLNDQWTYDYYVVIATNTIINRYVEFHRKMKIHSKAIIVQLETVVDNPLVLTYRIARSNTCKAFLDAYTEYVYPSPSVNYDAYMLSNRITKHPGQNFIPVIHLVGSFKAGGSEFAFLNELVHKKRMGEFMRIIRSSFPTAQFILSLFHNRKSGLFPETIGEPNISAQRYIDYIISRAVLQKSAQPYERYHDHFSRDYVNALPAMKDRKVATVIKPFYFLITNKIPNSVANVGKPFRKDIHYYHWTLKKRVPEVDGEICLLRTDTPKPITSNVPAVNDFITDIKQTYLTEYSFVDIVNSMVDFVRYILHKNEELMLNIPNVETQLEWSPVDYPGIPIVRRDIQVAVIRKSAYFPQYGTLFAHVMGRKGYSLQQMLEAYYNVKIGKITTTYLSKAEPHKVTTFSCEAETNNYVTGRFEDESYFFSYGIYIPKWVGFVSACLNKIKWLYHDRFALIFEDDLRREMLYPPGPNDLAKDLSVTKIFVVNTTRVKYDPNELKKERIYVIQAVHCSNLLTCVAALIADILGNYTPFYYV